LSSGLLHDIGKLILAAHADKDYKVIVQRSAKENTPVHLLEQEVLGLRMRMWALTCWVFGAFQNPLLAAFQLHHSLQTIEPGVFSVIIAIYAAQNTAEIAKWIATSR